MNLNKWKAPLIPLSAHMQRITAVFHQNYISPSPLPLQNDMTSTWFTRNLITVVQQSVTIRNVNPSRPPRHECNSPKISKGEFSPALNSSFESSVGRSIRCKLPVADGVTTHGTLGGTDHSWVRHRRRWSVFVTLRRRIKPGNMVQAARSTTCSALLLEAVAVGYAISRP